MKFFYGFITIFLLFLFITSKPSFAAAPVIQNVAVNPSSVGTYQKIEWTFDLSKSYPNPYYYYDSTDTSANNPSNMTWYGIDGVSVDLHITLPVNTTVPCFYFDDYLRVRNNGMEVLGRKAAGKWSCRYTPSTTGTYQYYLTATDKDGSSQYPASGTSSFTATTSSSKGFIHTSTKDSRFLAYDNGQSYVPIGAGHQWWNNQALKSYDFEDTFNTFGQNKINQVRVWDQQDYALGVESAQPVWTKQGTVYGPAEGVVIGSGTANVHGGMRSANPVSGNGWYQRLAINEPTKLHRLTVWIKTDSLSGGQAQVQVVTGTLFNSGTVLGTPITVSGTTPWTQYTTTFIPNNQVVTINLIQTATTGSVYIDDIAFGPDVSGNISYNIISDPDFERHFANGNPNNDPNANPNLPRPLGTYINQWAAYEEDKIVESAQTNNIALQLCSCSGPWFTWPLNPNTADWSSPWYLNCWKRNFRYRVARWGYSTAVLSWEYYNEEGHILNGTTAWTFHQNYANYQNYGNYQKSVDPYNHLKTTSQNSQAYSPGFWSTGAADLANYHDYLDFRSSIYQTLSPDEANFINRFAWCLRDTVTPVGSNPNCTSLGLGDGSTWTGPAKPWVWGEIGVWQGGTTPMQSGEAGKRFLHNIAWAGLFTPMATIPFDWYWDKEDSIATNAKYAARLNAANFFSTVDFDGGNFTYLMTPNDKPPSYSGETVTASDTNARVYAMRRADKKAVYLWVQNRNNTWSTAPTVPTAISPTLTIGNLLNEIYNVIIINTHTGTTISSTQKTPASGSLSIAVSNLTDDVAVKIESTTIPSPTPLPSGNPTAIPTSTGPTPTPVITLGNGDVNNDGKVDINDVVMVIKNYYTSGGPADQYGDGQVNALDFSYVSGKIPVSVPTPTGSGIPITTTLQIASSTDDVNEDGAAFSAADNPMWLGTAATAGQGYAGARFTNFTIPQGATITSASLDFNTPASWQSWAVSVQAENIGNSPVFGSSNKPSQRSLTTQAVSFSDNSNYTAGSWHTINGLAPVIQEVVNRGDWQSGNALSLILTGTSGQWGRILAYSFEGGAATAMKLTITYGGTGGGTTPTSTPTVSPQTPTPTVLAPTPTPSGPTPTSGPSTGEWTQFGHDAQRTSFTPQSVATPWKYKWQWNGAGIDGKTQTGHLSVPDFVQPITGGGRIYYIANNILFAFDKTSGSVLWQRGAIGNLNSTPAYDAENLYVASQNGSLYRINASTGAVVSSFAAGSPIDYSPLSVGTRIYLVTHAGDLVAVDKTAMTQIWKYAGGSISATPPSFSATKNMLIYLTQDLNVHTINTSGTLVWKKKPTQRIYENSSGNVTSASGAQAENGWPVIADSHGIVFVKYRLDWNTLWTWNPFPNTNSAINSNLSTNPSQQTLYALNLTDGSTAFIPNAGNGGAGDGGTLPMGPQPVIRNISGTEVAYTTWRNGLTCGGCATAGNCNGQWCDGREDATMGEMVLDGSTVSGYQAGDVRFVKFQDIQTDEMLYLTMSNDIIFHNHWLDSEAKQITNRGASLGNTFTNPITTVDAPNIIWRQCYCPATDPNCNPVIYPGGSGTTYCPANCPFNSTTRYCSSGLYSYGDQRAYPPGFYEYHMDNNGGSTAFTIVSDGLVLVKTYDGALMALENGNPTGMTNTQSLASVFKAPQVLAASGQEQKPAESIGFLDTLKISIVNNIFQPIRDLFVKPEKSKPAGRPTEISYLDAKKYVGKAVTAQGTIVSTVNNLPKAIYLGFKAPHDGALLVRIFQKDVSKFSYDPMTLKGKRIRVSGMVSLYWPKGVDPEIVVTDPKQIEVVAN